MNKTDKQLKVQRYVSGGGQMKAINVGAVGGGTLPTQMACTSSATSSNANNKFVNNGEIKYITTNASNLQQRLTFAQVAGNANVPNLMQSNGNANTAGIVLPATFVVNATPGVVNASAAAAAAPIPTVAVVPVIVANSHNSCNTGANVMTTAAGAGVAANGAPFIINNDMNANMASAQQQLTIMPASDGGTAKYVIATKNGLSSKEDIINQIILGKTSSPRPIQATVIKRTIETPLPPVQQKLQNQQKALKQTLPTKQPKVTAASSGVLMNSSPNASATPTAPISITTDNTKTITDEPIHETVAISNATMSQVAVPQATNEFLNTTSRATTVITVLPTNISNVISTVAEPASLLKTTANGVALNRHAQPTDSAAQLTNINGPTVAAAVENSILPDKNAKADPLTLPPSAVIPPRILSKDETNSPRKRAQSLQNSINEVVTKSTTNERRHSAAAITHTRAATSSKSAITPIVPIEEKNITEEDEEELILCTPTKYKQKPSNAETVTADDATDKTDYMNVYEEEEYLDSSPEKSLLSIIEDMPEDEQMEEENANTQASAEEEHDDDEEEIILPDLVYTQIDSKAIEKEIKKEITTNDGYIQEGESKAVDSDDDNDLIIIEPNDAIILKEVISKAKDETEAREEQQLQEELAATTERLECHEELQMSSSTNNSLQESTTETILPNKSTSQANASEDNNMTSAEKGSLPNLRMRKNPQVFPIVKTKPAFSKIMKQPQPPNIPDANSYSAVLEMISNYNMLNWKERVGTARGTKMQFQLNEYNLLQIFERCPTRVNVQTAYERPIYERETGGKDEEVNPLLYLCRRCNCHGPATDFLAPEFCSLDCLKRDTRKRKHTTKQSRNHRTLQLLQQFGTAANMNNWKEVLAMDAGNKRKFRWSTYMTTKFGGVPAPINLFLNPFPISPNPFVEGMKVEAIDPENCSLFCVCTVVKVQGYRLKLHFDGYDKCYDFWVNADSMDIFPPGWCSRTGRLLQPPRYMDQAYFNWSRYVKNNACLAMRHLFTHLNSAETATVNPFKINMHLEAEDLNDTGKLCVATVADVINDRIRIHFDGWDDCYDYWVHISSPYIHPCGWHEGRQQLIVPPDYENIAFDWPEYIRSIGKGCAATEELFCVRDPINFEPNMKLEVVDPRNPSLIRPASIITRRGHRIKVHLECWPAEYCFWMEDDSPDLHPIGWCDDTGHDLEPPPGFYQRLPCMPCDVPGCRGIGNAKTHTSSTHAMSDACPYAPLNWRNKLLKPQRLNADRILRPPAYCAPFAVELKEHKSLMATPVCAAPMQQPAPAPEYEQICCDVEPTIGMYIKQETVEIKEERVEQMVDNDVQMVDNDVQMVEVTKPLESLTAKMPTPLAAKPLSALTNSLEIQVAKEFLSDYGPRLQQNYELLQHNFKFNLAEIKTNPLNWTTKKTAGFVERLLDSKVIARKFLMADIDGSSLLMLQQSDLTDGLDLKLGPAIKLYTSILQLRTFTMLTFDIKPPIVAPKMSGT